MAKKASERKFNPKLIWKELELGDWQNILEQLNPNGGWKQHSDRVRGLCPNHAEKTPSFFLNPKAGYAKCYGCNYYLSDPVELVSKVSGKTYSDSLAFILNEKGGNLPSVPASAIKSAKEYGARLAMRQLLARLFNQELVEAAGDYLQAQSDATYQSQTKYKYAYPTLEYLKSRHIPLDLLHALRIGIIPLESNLHERIAEQAEKHDMSGLWPAVQEAMEPVSVGKEGWLAFPYCFSPTELSAFRVREPGVSGAKNIRSFLHENEHYLGFYGLDTPVTTQLYGMNKDNQLGCEVLVVEGEFDALSLLVPQVQTQDPVRLVAAFGGKAAQSLDPLQATGAKALRVIADWDGTAGDVLKGLLRNTTHLPYTIFQRPQTDPIFDNTKDVHDIFKKFHLMAEDQEPDLDACLEIFYNEDNYVYPVEWVFRLAAERAGALDENDIKGRTGVIAHHLGILSDDSEKLAALDKLETSLDMNLDVLKRRSIEDSEESFVNALQDFINEHFVFLYEFKATSGLQVGVWSKLKDRERVLDLGSHRSSLAAIRGDLGSTLNWVEEHIGIPAILQERLDVASGKIKPLAPREIRRRHYEQLLIEEVLPNIIQQADLNQYHDMEIKGPGVHVIDENKIYIVNGRHLFKGVRAEHGGFEWTRLTIPVDESWIFNPNLPMWSDNILSVDDLNEAPSYSLEEAFTLARKVLDTGYLFKAHDYDVIYLAAYAAVIPLSSMLDVLPWIQFRGHTTSGKSSVSDLLGAKKTPLKLIEHAVGFDSWTEAGLRNYMNSSTLAFFVDEFESNTGGHGKRSQQTQETLELLRNAMKGGASSLRSTRGGNTITSKLRFSLVSAAIAVFQNPQDRNRVNRIEMATEGERLDKIKRYTPEGLIEDAFGYEGLADLRRKLTLAALGNMDAIRGAYKSIEKEYKEADFLDENTHSRFREQLTPILALLKAAGQDYREFGSEYTKLKVQVAADSGNTHAYEELLSVILHTPKVRLNTYDFQHQVFTVNKLINDRELLPELNSVNMGIYYVEERDMVVFFWPGVVMSELLRGSQSYGSMSAEALKTVMDQDTRAIKIGIKDMPLIKQTIPGKVLPNQITCLAADHFRGDYTKPFKVIEGGGSDFEDDAIFEDSI